MVCRGGQNRDAWCEWTQRKNTESGSPRECEAAPCPLQKPALPPQPYPTVVSMSSPQVSIFHSICWLQDLADRMFPPAASRRVKIWPLVRLGHPTFNNQVGFCTHRLSQLIQTFFLWLRNLGLDIKNISPLSAAYLGSGEFTCFD